MKNIIFITIICLLNACSTKQEKVCMQDLYILADISDTLFALDDLTEESICKQLEVTKKTALGANVHFIFITNFRYTKDVTISITDNASDRLNEVERKWEVDSFRKSISEQCERIKESKKSIIGSAIFESLSRVLQVAKEKHSCTDIKVMLLSDLRQFSSLCNTYDTLELNSFTRHFKDRINWLDSTCNFPQSLKEFTIYFIHQSKTMKEDIAFDIISTFMKKYLMQKGATVFIRTSIQ